MRGKKRKILLMVLAFACLFAGCNSSDQKEETTRVEGLDQLGAVEVISREDGSGTRSTFAQLAGFASESADSKQSDDTTEDAVIAESAEEVIEKVGEGESAIGYISMGASEELDQEKVLKVDGVEGSKENVEKGKYPLSRSFYLAHSGELSDLEQDFLTYVKGKGQEIVEASFVPIGKSSTFLSNQSEGTIVIHGSTSVAPLMEELAAEYMKINSNGRIQVEASDSTAGLTDAMQGACDFGMSSRELKDYEKELLDYDMIAKDGIEVIVNQENPLEDISLEQLKDIFTGTIHEWEELNAG
ncbi:MAG: substrate-binding domain-containing protein [Dorea sp.]